MAHLGRSSWTSASNGAVSIKQSQRHVTLHYPGFGTDSVRTADWSRERCFQQLRSWRNMHVGSGAYKEVAYNFYALPTGDFVDGRGLRQNGANGTGAANRAGLSIQVLIGDNEDLTAGHIRAVNDCLAYIKRHYPSAVGTIYGHQRWVSTRCPGPKVMAALRAGKFGAGRAIAVPGPGASAPAAPSPAASEPSNSGLADVDKSQRWLTDLGYEPGPIDGSFGDKTQAATRAFQIDMGITPADGRPGPATRKELEDMASKIVELEKKVDRLIAFGEQNQWRLDNLPAKVLDAPVKLKGEGWEGKTATLRGVREWYAADAAAIKKLIVSQWISDAEVARIADAVIARLPKGE